jgi:eukaryotic-like serine/threonine-protein kinase
MALISGTKLGPYEILTPAGAGGMGEVYRARDARLNRDVAIKVLPVALASDPERLRRFQQEAQAVAALNHPNILAVYDFGAHQGSPYMVTEFLEGETLRERLHSGALPVREATEYAEQVAKGLAVAHEKGIVHRDLKPENVFLARDGRLKILDFGLAKLTRPEGAVASDAPTMASQTEAGMVLGTVGYMSPEQVRGEASDARSDIFSFGALLYEILTGKRAFKRDTATETMTAILREDPPELNETGWQGPMGLPLILGRCLEKNVERRFQSASDLAFAIESLSGTSTSAARTLAQSKARRAWWPWAATVLSVMALVAVLWFAARSSQGKTPATFTRLTFEQGFLSNARFAKGGDAVVYSAQWNDQPMAIYSVRLEFPQSVKVQLPSAAMLALSTSGDLTVAIDPVYRAGFLSGTMAQAPIAGGSPRPLEEGVISADYASDGKTMAVVRHADRRVQLEYPAGHVIYSTAGYLDYVRVSPSGKQVAFLEHSVYDDDRGWVALVDAAGYHRKLTKEFAGSLQGLAWSRTGTEIWFSAADEGADLQLFAVTLSGRQRAILGAPQRTRILDISADGRVLVSNEQYRREIMGIDPATGKELRRLEWFNASGMVDILRDGKAILFVEFGGAAGPLYLVAYRKLDGSAPVALGPGAWPKFSPDGTTAAAVVLSRPPQIALHPIGTGESRRLPVGDIVNMVYVSWFPYGKHLMLVGATEGQPLRTYEIDLQGGTPQPLGPTDFIGKAVSRDGSRIAGRNGAGEAVVFAPETKNLKIMPGVKSYEQFQQWTEDGQSLLVSSGTPWEAHVDRVEVANGARTLLQRVELADKAGSNLSVGLTYAETSKTYVYNTRRILGTLYVVDGLR